MTSHHSTVNDSRVSVIIPCFNALTFLRKAVESVINQSYSDWELIVINDGSEDETELYLHSLDHPSVEIVHQPNRGVSAARNAGLERATGKYITFLDADDELPPESLAVRAAYLDANPDVQIADGAVSVRDHQLEIELRRYRPYYRGELLPRLLSLDDRVFFNVCYMFRRSALKDIRFPEHMTHAEDLAFFVMLADKGNLTYGHVDEVVYHYCSGNDSAMSNLGGLERGYLSLIDIVRDLRNPSALDRNLLKLRIAKILLLSWRAHGNRSRGVAAALRALSA